MNVFQKFIDKLFLEVNWAISFMPCKDPKEIINSKTTISLEKLRDNNGYWYADPLPYYDENGFYLFAEAISKKSRKGAISVFKIENKNMIDLGLIIDEPFHMSYPFVFKFNNIYYMIPETNAAKSLRIYRANDYPLKWTLVKELFVGQAIVDTDVIVNHPVFGNTFIFLIKDNGENKLQYYQFDNDFNCTLIETLIDINKDERGAGLFIEDGADLIRPSQVYGEKYGEMMRFRKLSYNEGHFTTTDIGEIQASRCQVNGEHGDIKVHRVHTFSYLHGMLFIDYFEHHINLLKPFKKLFHHK